MAAEKIICSVCGASNAANMARCQSCGAKLDALTQVERTEEEEAARRYQQDGFEWKWVFISFGIYVTLQAIILAALPMVIETYDPQGLPGLLISAGVWFVGGMLVGAISPGKTFIEPSVGAFMATVPTIAWLMHIADWAQLSLLSYLIFGMLGVMVTLFGAFLGEKIQMMLGGK